MYRHCIYCSGHLGSNESIESFPVGRSIAFDAGRGRLWAVCPKCARWNLSPFEERWEAVEEAEKRFADSHLRAQSENVGLAKLADGTRLIRVGRALPGELAAWRYGGQLRARRARHLAVTTVATAAAAGVVLGGAVFTSVSLAGTWMAYRFLVRGVVRRIREHRVVHVAADAAGPRGAPAVVRRGHLADARVARSPDGGIELRLPAGPLTWREIEPGIPRLRNWLLVFRGDAARTALGRALVHANQAGARAEEVDGAVKSLAEAGSSEAYLDRMARARMPLFDAPSTLRLALEMALHEEQERRAMQGELALLEAAWREAEEIAAIADRLASGAFSTASIALAGSTGDRPAG